MVPDLHAPDRGADLLDDAGAFVSEHRRQRHRQIARDHVQVAMADAARPEADEHLVGAWCSQGERFDADGVTDGIHDGGAHGPHPEPPRSLYGDRCRAGKARRMVRP